MKGYWGKASSDRRQHIYFQPYGYPIRLCNYQHPEGEMVEVEEAKQCKLCQLSLNGKRKVCFAPKVIDLEKQEAK